MDQASIRNAILSKFPDAAFASIAPHLEQVCLPNGSALASAGERIGHIYFLNSGIGSIVAETPDGQCTEAGLFGREGWAPTELVLGSDHTLHSIVIQIGGDGLRIGRAAFLECVEAYPKVRHLLGLFAQTMAAQTSFTALSNAVHRVEERLARWLLMCHDRVEGDELPLTHEFLSVMLSVRRPSISSALHILEGRRYIRAVRGMVTIRDRASLEAFATDTYGRPEEEYRRLIGPFGKLSNPRPA